MDRASKNKKTVKLFTSLQEENEYEYERRRKMTPEERMQEFGILQARQWGKNWGKKKIKKVVSIEKIF